MIEEYIEEKLGFYQLLANDGLFKTQVQTGGVDFKREFDNGDDSLLNKSLEFSRKHRCLRIS